MLNGYVTFVYMIVYASYRGRWKWNKDILRRSKLFTAENGLDVNINNSADYPRICAEFERLRVISGSMGNWEVTRNGMLQLSNAAGLSVIPGSG